MEFRQFSKTFSVFTISLLSQLLRSSNDSEFKIIILINFFRLATRKPRLLMSFQIKLLAKSEQRIGRKNLAQ